MRVFVSLLGLLLLPVVVGCEGNTPRRSPFASTSSPTSAKAVEYAPLSQNPVPGARPLNPTDPNNQPAAGNPAPAANGPITLDGDKLETRRQLLMYHTAIFLKKEVGTLTTTGITENNNFVFRPSEGLNKLQIIPLVFGVKADKGKPPQTVQELKTLIGEFLTQLEPNEFYVYDPEQVIEANKEEMLFIQQYP